MSFMKKNLNFGLFLLVIATLLCFAGFSVYYQKTYFNLTQEYKNKVENIDHLVTTLNLEKTKLNQTSYQLQLKADRETDLTSKYTTLSDEKDKLQQDITNLETSLSQTKADLNQKTLELAAAKSNLATTQQQLADANTEIITLDSQISDLRDKVNILESQLNIST